MTILYLARHGETDWNAEHRWQGHADPPLNATGRRQARRMADELSGRGIEAVYSSDLRRALETATIAGERLGLDVRTDERLREVDVGEWSGLTMAEVEERHPEAAARRRAGGLGWERGETFESMGARVGEAVLAIAAAHPDGRVLVVSHGGPIRMLRRSAGYPPGAPALVGNCEVGEIAVRREQIRWLDSSRGGLHQQVQR